MPAPRDLRPPRPKVLVIGDKTHFAAVAQSAVKFRERVVLRDPGTVMSDFGQGSEKYR